SFAQLSTPTSPRSSLFPYTTLFRSQDRRLTRSRIRLTTKLALRCGRPLSDHSERRLRLRLIIQLRGGVDETQLERLRHHNSLRQDRKSTRLNSSHVKISYAVLCLKK